LPGLYPFYERHLFLIMNKFLTCILLLPVWLSSLQPSSSVSGEVVVHAVLFYSPTCGHCHMVITETITPLVEQYGEQFYIVGVDVSQPSGQAIFQAALQYFNLESGGVPFLVIGDTYLIGSVDIPEKLPGMIEQYLAQGGLDWPPIPGFAEAMAAAEATQAAQAPTQAPTQETASATAAPSQAAPTPAPTTNPATLITSDNMNLSPWERLALDPVGNGLAVVVLAGMIVLVTAGIMLLQRSSSVTRLPFREWLIPVLCIIGMVVAGYLAYVETARVEAVCGPVGDCNTVQQSEYARLFGILPIGVLGLVGYVMILLAWGVERWANQRLATYASLAIFGMTTFGLLFSIYLTFLEPFVIGATCAWCLASAIIMTLLFWWSLAPARDNLKLVSGQIRVSLIGEKHG